MNKKQKRKPTKWNVENVEWNEFIISYYKVILNLNKDPCALNSCKKNCSDNPYCLNKLGPSEWLSDAFEVALDDAKSENFAAGLVNYGSTCYLNSLLQIYFHILSFRMAIFNYPVKDIPDDVIMNLQTIFSEMQSSYHKCVSPFALVQVLGLSDQEQQDAPELHSLLLSMLEGQMELVHDATVKDTFTGQQSYCTKCKVCGYCSTVDCQFREIDLKPLSTVETALSDFTKAETLTGDNQYHCSSCASLCDGERWTELRNLPPVLTLQLLRYSYDNSGNKKKNSICINFSEQLQMSKYIASSNRTKKTVFKYTLKAILIHLGTEPTSGHYQTIIHNKLDEWIFFDDSNVRKLDGPQEVQKILNPNSKKHLVKGITDNNSDSQTQFWSSNAYMLFYQRQDVYSQYSEMLSTVTIPNHLQEELNIINTNYLTKKQDEELRKEEDKLRRKERMTQLKLCLQQLQVVTWTENLALFPTQRLRQLLMENADGQSAWDAELPHHCDWEHLLCGYRHHGDKIGPNISLSRFRVVRTEGLDALVDANLLSVSYRRLTLPDALCHRCWRLQFELKRFELMAKSDQIIDGYKKSTEPLAISSENGNEKRYWVSKSDIRNWRKWIRSLIEVKFGDDKNNSDCDSIGGRSNGSSVGYVDNRKPQQQQEGDEENEGVVDENVDGLEDGETGDASMSVLNIELECEHGGLSLESSKRGVIVLSKVWQRLMFYLERVISGIDCDGNSELSKYYREFSVDTPNCHLCQQQSTELQAKAESERQQSLTFLKSVKRRFDIASYDEDGSCVTLTPLYAVRDSNNSPRTNFEDYDNPQRQIYFIPTSFVQQWRKFVRSPLINTLITELDYSDVYCSHGQLLQKPWHELLKHEALQLLWPSEWQSVTSTYGKQLQFSGMALNLCQQHWLGLVAGKVAQLCTRNVGSNGANGANGEEDSVELYNYNNYVCGCFYDGTQLCHDCYRSWIESHSQFDDGYLVIRLTSSTLLSSSAVAAATDFAGAAAGQGQSQSIVTAATDNYNSNYNVDEDEVPPPASKKRKIQNIKKSCTSSSINENDNIMYLSNDTTAAAEDGTVGNDGNYGSKQNKWCTIDVYGSQTTPRRSTRTRYQTSDMRIYGLSSADTVRKLKVQLMHQLYVSPMDQHLYFQGRELTDLNSTLASEKLQSGNTILLTLDVAPQMQQQQQNIYSSHHKLNGDENSVGIGYAASASETNTNAIETGFIGTKLMKFV